MWLMLVLITPIGLIMLWKNKKYAAKTKWIAAAIFSVWFIVMAIVSQPTEAEIAEREAKQEQIKQDREEKKIAKEKEKAKKDAEKKKEEEEAKKKAEDEAEKEEEKKEKEKEEKEKQEEEAGEEEAKKEKNNEVDEYKDEIVEITQRLADHMFDFSEQTTEVGNDPSAMYTDDWVLRSAATVVSLDAELDNLEELEAPEEMKEIQEELQSAIDLYRIIAKEYPSAVDNLDVEMMEEISLNIVEGNKHIQKATDLAATK